MASEHVVLLTTVDNVKPHPNADNLEIVEIEGWQVVAQKDKFKAGSLVVFVPVDSVVPDTWANEWGIKNYLGGGQHDRVRCVRLRGEPSYGFIVPIPEGLDKTKPGTDVKDFFGITKYCPPVRGGGSTAPQGKPRPVHPLLDKYTDIDNLRNMKNAFHPGELVVITEKVHGTSVRVSLLDTRKPRMDFKSKFMRFFKIKNRTEIVEEFVCGSHNVQRDIPDNPAEIPYTYPLTIPGTQKLLKFIKDEYKAKQVILYGEVFGPSIQKLHYGIKKGYGFQAFDIKIDGKYLDSTIFFAVCQDFGVPTVPVLYSGKYDTEMVKELAEGQSTLPGANHIREGVIVKPVVENVLTNGKRKILKCKGAGYLIWKESKKGSDYTEE